MDAFISLPAPSLLRTKDFSKLHHSAADACLDRPEGQPKKVRDFRLGHRREERQFDDLALVLRKLFHCLTDQLARLCRGEGIEGSAIVELVEELRLKPNL